MAEENKPCGNCPKLTLAKSALSYLAKRPEGDQHLLVKTACICLVLFTVIMSLFLGAGLTLYIKPFLDHFMPASIQEIK